ncbi:MULTISPECIES: ABC transporter ATP-binding protein [Microbacterium]|jgi:ABC-2 type transport system ATP-binding protein|uniref:ABC transporter ATP-binding protein n=1 Tax=Microbacterium TaxID=33882 RepID=UPI00248EC00A|nr:ATP-binding cassette domain-containing protein [Microbacterium aurum]
MITAEGLTKRYGEKTAVSDATFTVQTGKVTGFLGPNGAGKSTTMRMIVGLDAPTAGSVAIDGRPYRAFRSPLTEVGALLDAKAVHTGRSARDHLRVMAATHGIPRRRVDEVIELAGLTSVASKRAGKFSLGMGQRLGIASALLGDPHTLILDEPVNGLDPEGVRWVRGFVRALAAEGRTVLLSSHLMSEMSLTADHVIVLGRGRVLADAPIDRLVQDWTQRGVAVASPRLTELAALLSAPDVTITPTGDGTAQVEGLGAPAIGDIAAAHGIPLHALAETTGSLEDAYMALTADAVEYTSKELS